MVHAPVCDFIRILRPRNVCWGMGRKWRILCASSVTQESCARMALDSSEGTSWHAWLGEYVGLGAGTWAEKVNRI